MARGRVVTSPDGERWRVRRRWMDRGLPNLRKRFREAKEERSPIDGFDGLMIMDGATATGWTGLGIGVAALLLFIVFLPLLGVALEVILLATALAADGPPERLVAGERTTLPRPGF